MIWANIKSAFCKQEHVRAITPAEEADKAVTMTCGIIADMQSYPDTKPDELEAWYALLYKRMMIRDVLKDAEKQPNHTERRADLIKKLKALKTEELQHEIKLGLTP